MIGTLIALYFALCVVSNTTHPILVVSSQSMKPTFSRGDIIFLSNRTEEVRVGDIPVVWFSGRKEPMVHRAIKVEQDRGLRLGEDGHVTQGNSRCVADLLLRDE